MLNSQQAKLLFQNEAVILGTYDGVPLYRAAELFGEKATKFAAEMGVVDMGHRQIVYSNCFGIGDYQCDYLTMDGFLVAATYANAQEIRAKEEQAHREQAH